MLLQSGRACLRVILETERPGRLVVPFYVCDAVLDVPRALGVPIVYYHLDPVLDPQLPNISETDLVLVVDYFGLHCKLEEEHSVLGHRLVVDQSQALFAGGSSESWRFTSARKWFGVPDGAFLWGPRQLSIPMPAASSGRPNHLIERLWGDASLAYESYRAAEESFGLAVAPISRTSILLLGGVDVDAVKLTRRKNFVDLNERLGDHNCLNLNLAPDQVPFCYAMLPQRAISKRDLASDGIFVPSFWEDCVRRANTDFSWEIDLSQRLLPLPIDHRYGPEEMERIAEHVLRRLRV
jgi:hypothetical protein